MRLSRGNKLILSICELVAGILLLINPVYFTNVIIVAFGVLLLFAGIISILNYFKAEPETAAREQKLAKGLLAVIAGAFCTLKSSWFIMTFPLLTVLYGVMTLITGIAKLQGTVDLYRMRVRKWFLAAISSAITLICSAVILSNPFSSTVVLWVFIAVNLIIEAVFDVISAIFVSQ